MKPYLKAVVAAVIGLVGVLVTSYFDGRVDQVSLSETIGAVITALVALVGVYAARNSPIEQRRRG